ncbi:MAG: BamA/TamA family outer membrane protein [Kofleriaceae bacterium]
MRCVVLLICALLWAACGHGFEEVRSHTVNVEWLYELKLEETGAKSVVDPTDVLPALQLTTVAKAQRSIDEYALQLDTQRVIGAYQRLGYLGVDVKTRIDKRYKAYPDAATLVFVVNPGKRANVHLEFFGLPSDVPFDEVRKAVGVKENSLFDYDTYDSAKEPLLDLMQDHGYAHARLEGTVIADRAKALATLRFVVDPGPTSKFGQITVTGISEPMLIEAVLARVTFDPGQPYSRQKLVDTQSAIYSVGLFSAVRVEPQTEGVDPTVPVKITLTKTTQNEASLGGGGAYDPVTYSIRGRATWTRHGVITPLTTSALDFRPEYAFEKETCSTLYFPWTCKSDFRGRLSETLTQQDLFITNVKGDAEVGVDYLVYEAYSKLGAHARLGIGAPIFTKKLQARIGWLYQIADFTQIFLEQYTLDEQKLVKTLGLDHTNYIGAYTGALILDLRDNPINTNDGFYAEVRMAKGTRYALGDFDYFQITPDVRGYLSLAPNYVLAARIKAGTIVGDVPATERYFGGGATDNRGFARRYLSPYAPLVDDPYHSGPVGGAGMFQMSLELRAPLPFKLAGFDLTGTLFLDGGDVTFDASDLSLSNLQWAAGVGIAFATPIGPVGFNAAYRLNRTNDAGALTPVTPPYIQSPEVGSHLNLSIAVGQAF